MNAGRRALLANAVELLQWGRDTLETAAAEEREAFDSLPESLQDAERGQAMSEAADELDDLVSQLDGLMDQIADRAQ